MIRLLDIIKKIKSLNILEKFSKVKTVKTVKIIQTLKKYLGSEFSGCFFSKFKKKEPDKIIRPKIYAPITYWELSPEEKKEICNGCGAKDGLKVPDTFWGLNIEEACNIHDYMYNTGKTHYDKLFADAMFRLNLTVIIDAKETFKEKLLSVLRHYRAGTYYIAVAKYGNYSFWKDKERLSPEDPMAFRITFTGEFRNLEELQNEFTKEIIENLTKIENLDTIKEFKEETLEVLDTMVKDSLNLSKK